MAGDPIMAAGRSGPGPGASPDGPTTRELPVVSRARRRRAVSALSLVGSVLAVGVVYLWGLLAGSLSGLHWDNTCDQVHSAGEPAFDHAQESLLPLHWACVRADGSRVELVPAAVNPLLAAATGSALGSAALLVLGARRDRRRAAGLS